MAQTTRLENRLAQASSPYLLQHADPRVEALVDFVHVLCMMGRNSETNRNLGRPVIAVD